MSQSYGQKDTCPRLEVVFYPEQFLNLQSLPITCMKGRENHPHLTIREGQSTNLFLVMIRVQKIQ